MKSDQLVTYVRTHPNLGVPVATNFRVIGGDCRLADSSGVSRPGNWIPFDSISFP